MVQFSAECSSEAEVVDGYQVAGVFLGMGLGMPNAEPLGRGRREGVDEQYTEDT